ncbi:MAG TPA: GGDEF domain-containing protein [Pseudolabrys sp.]|jgi:diguanylate cyclase (GGDEF)-like protein
MPVADHLQPLGIDVHTLAFVAVCLGGLIGLYLILSWLQQRDVRALAWWGAAYLIGASAMVLWSTPAPWLLLPPELPEALTFLACGLIWNGIRLFHGRRLVPAGAYAAPIGWLIASQLPVLAPGGHARLTTVALVVAGYTFVIAFELWRERRTSLFSRAAAFIVPSLHAGVFLMPLALQVFAPDAVAGGWLAVFAMETLIYAVGTAFIVVLMVKDHHVHMYRHAASTDHLTGLLNRRAFLESALNLCALHGARGAPVTLMMFDLDHFKKINDRFGHAIGDDALRVFAEVARTSMRSTDIIGRLGGEEFAAIVPGAMDVALKIGERLRSAFETAGVTISSHAIGATVSIGAATSHARVENIDALLARADEALYHAKHTGRNRLHAVEDATPQPAQAPRDNTLPFRRRKSVVRRPVPVPAEATSRLP